MDPVFTTKDHRLLSTLWSHHLVGRPENELTGVDFSSVDIIAAMGSTWRERRLHGSSTRPLAFEGTQVKKGSEFGGKDTIVGYECDGCEMEWREGLPFPTHRDGTPKELYDFATDRQMASRRRLFL